MRSKSAASAFVANACSSVLFALLLLAVSQSVSAQAFINEIHYDNDGTDVGEAIEIAGAAGLDLTGWSFVLYNGSNGTNYNTINLAGTIPNQMNGAGTVVTNLPSNGLQNGSPDGLALVDDNGSVVQFLSYEGTFQAADGPAAGMTSTDIGVAESSTTAPGLSLQLTGTGSSYADFAWSMEMPATFGFVNTGQVFDGPVAATGTAFINEIHYDNDGTDVGEGIEVAGTAGLDLTGWSLVLYNGSNGTPYDTLNLAGTLTDQAGGLGFVAISLPVNGLQNGSPDGIALIDNTGALIQFLSYEGSFIATSGPAAGAASTDILVGESSTTPAGLSLQLTGTGTEYADFTWADPQPDTFGMANAGQNSGSGGGPGAGSSETFINEIHYDNLGGDVGEAIEVAGTAGTDLTGWSLVLYNGSNGTVYNTVALAGTLSNQAGGFGFAVTNLPSNGLQNGSPDGIALVDDSGTVIQFLSYEGTLVASDGPAAGMESTDIGVAELGTTSIGFSLQLTGTGLQYSDFTWSGPVPNTFGDANTGQTFESNARAFINEFHYDNIGSDVGEAIEVAGTAGTDLTGWSLVFYNGFSGTVYNTAALGSVLSDQSAGFGFEVIDLAANGLQNGSPDGIALVDASGGVIQFLSYEGTFIAADGPAVGMESENIGVTESSSTPVGYSLQLTGTGDRYEDFTWSEAGPNTFGSVNTGQSFGDDGGPGGGPPLLKISEVQGGGLASPEIGNAVVIEGIVVGDFQDGVSGTHGDLNGFFVQEEDADADGDSQTSEGIFVFDGDVPAVDVIVGDKVRVEGVVSEFGGLTEITSFTGVSVISQSNPLPTPAVVTLPVASVDDFEAFEGMAVTFPQSLVISEYFNFDRFGEIVLTSTRRLTPTAEFEPGPDAILAAEAFLLDRITLDDGRTASNPDPAIHPNGLEFDLSNLFRGGDTLQDVTGVMSEAFGLYRIQPTGGANYANDNPRTDEPADVGGSLKVASFNVLNYFSTLDDGVNDICGPQQNLECRGADDAEEFTRQRDKIIAALTAIDADIVGLIEIENNINDDALIDLVDGLNAANGGDTYDFVSSGPIGTDAIKVAFIYKPASVSLAGGFAVLDSSVDARFNDSRNRPALAQTFMDSASGGVVTVTVNHLKSKGSSCDDLGDPDTGDGAGNCNVTRTLAAEALVAWLATDPTGSGSENALIIGDLNSYDKEDPIDAIRNGGYTDLVDAFLGEDAYGYVFDGQVGYLDHALANAALNSHVTGLAVWHINADEPDLIDYDTSFKQPNQDAIYAPDAYRSSDHDPVVIGLDLPPEVPAPTDVRGRAKFTKVFVSWTDVGADSYDVFRSEIQGGPYVLLGSADSRSFLDTTVATGNTYYYVVQSVIGGARSLNSNEAVVPVTAGRRR